MRLIMTVDRLLKGEGQLRNRIRRCIVYKYLISSVDLRSYNN